MDIKILKIGGINLIDCIAKTLRLEKDYLKLIGESENFVYHYRDNFILRVSPFSHRNIEELYAELEWIEFLNENGIPAARGVAFESNELIRDFISHEVQFYAIFFELAKGEKLNIRKSVNEKMDGDFYALWGKTLGRMHKIAKTYIPSNYKNCRKQWNETIPRMCREQDRESYPIVIEKQEKLLKYLYGLPKSVETYGLIHSDFTYDNFFVHDSKIYPFDFDHCKYHWFIYDIAILLDTARYLPGNGMDSKTQIKHFFDCFMNGYINENTIEDFWINQIPEFTKLWKIDSFIPIINKADMQNLEVWEKRLLTKMKYDIENEIPYFTP